MAVRSLLAIAAHFASEHPRALSAVVVAATLALPMAVAWFVARGVLRRGHGVRLAAAVAFALAAVAAALTPLAQLYLLCTVARDCL